MRKRLPLVAMWLAFFVAGVDIVIGNDTGAVLLTAAGVSVAVLYYVTEVDR